MKEKVIMGLVAMGGLYLYSAHKDREMRKVAGEIAKTIISEIRKKETA